MIIKNFKPLIQQMKIRKPILLLGAGFSIGAVNANGEKVKMGGRLAESLFHHFYEEDGKLSKTSDDIKSSIAKEKWNLKAICTYLRTQNVVSERNAYIAKEFTGCQLVDDAPQWSLAKYPWSYIFTLNIDDLVENIYNASGFPCAVLDLSNLFTNESMDVPRIVKLHGSVSDIKSGFIFDDYEYRDYNIKSNSLLKEFAHQMLTHDIIMVGTEFQEDDLLTILDIYQKSGYDESTYKRFYVTPMISNINLRLKLEDSKNDIWIKGNTEEFMNELQNKIIAPAGKKDALKEKGVHFLCDDNKHIPPSFGLYKGEDSVYADFYHEADIIRPEIPLIQNGINDSSKQIISLYGASYIGKTCCAKRLLVDFYNKGYDAVQVSFLSNQVLILLRNYWEEFDDDVNVAVYIERATDCYKEALMLLRDHPSNIKKMIIITEDTTENHLSKRYVLLGEKNYREYEIHAQMNYLIAQAICDKLISKRRLNHYVTFLPERTNLFSKQCRDIVIPQIQKESDIIDALYFASEGRDFKKHYENWLRKNLQEKEMALLQQICCLGKLGIDRIPILLFDIIGQRTIGGFDIKSYIQKFSEILKTDRNYIVFRRYRILFELIDCSNTKLNMQLIKDIAKFCVPPNEYEHTEWRAIFQKAIRVKRIGKNNILPSKKLLELLYSLEDTCNHVSYFWVQYGIAAQLIGNYEDANNHLLYAKNMRPDSYQVRHALAKNSMEWGLFLIVNGDIDIGTTKFKEGVSELKELIDNKRYSDSYRYSVHVMVNMYLKYYDAINMTMETSICFYLSSILEKLLISPLDNLLIDLIKDFIYYCDAHGLNHYCNAIRKVNKMRPFRKVDSTMYDLD